MDTLTASAPSRLQPRPPATRPTAPADGRVHRRDLGGATPWLFYGGLMVAAVLVLMTAGGLDVAGNTLGILGGGLLHGAVAALVVGLYLERVHTDWTFLKGGQHVLMLLALLIVAPVTFLVDRFVLHLGLAVVPTVAYVVVAVASALGAGVMTFLVVCPSHLGRRQRAVFLPFVGLFGLAAGVLAMALVVAGLAVWRMHRLPDVHISVPIVSGIEGDYVALGDSYSAGEGLRPFSWYTGDAGTSRDDGCHRSARAYSQLLVFAGGQTATRFAACSGAVTRDLEHGLTIHQDDGTAVRIPPQIDGKVHPNVGLVTLTIGGNDVVFSSVVRHCFFHQRCLAAGFTPPTDVRVELPPKAPLATWATAAISLLRDRVDGIYRDLRTGYPNARIVVVGYPYLFPSGRASRWPDDCYSLLRRFSEGERNQLRALTDDLNATLHQAAVSAGIEFVSPAAIWDGHEPCGSKGQYTNSFKAIFSFRNPVDGGSFHPNAHGQEALARLVACYLNAYPQPPVVSPAGGAGTPAVGVPGSIEHPLLCPPAS
jgi:GDSL-like Lipase/Acylhydrolase family